VLIFLLFILAGSFTAGLIILIKSQGNDEMKSNQEATTAYQDQVTEYYAGPVLTQQQDWNIIYGVPTCFIQEGEGGWTSLGETRIHWLKVEEGEVQGTQIAGDTTIIFTGTIDGTHLTITDNQFGSPGMIKPFQIIAEFDRALTEFTGTYTAQYYLKGVPFPVCPTDGSVSGPVSAKPIE